MDTAVRLPGQRRWGGDSYSAGLLDPGAFVHALEIVEHFDGLEASRSGLGVTEEHDVLTQ